MATVDIGGNTYEVYGDVAAAEDYMVARLGSEAWMCASANDRAKALVSATRMLERTSWQGDPTGVLGQVLAWPRTGLLDKEGDALDDQTVPQEVVDASFELALKLLEDAELQDQVSAESSNIKRLKAGSAEIEYFRQVEGTKLPTVVSQLVGCWTDSSTRTVGRAYGTDRCSSFDGTDWDRNDPYA